MTDTVIYSDSGTWDLANRVTSIANASESVNLGGSLYHIDAIDAAAAAAAFSGGATKSLSSTANATELVTADRATAVVSSANATSSVTASKKDTLSINDSANATEEFSSSVAANTQKVTDTAAATATVTPIRVVTLTSSGAAVETVTRTRKSTASVADVANATDAPAAPAVQQHTDVANATETIVGVRRSSVVIQDTGGATATSVSGGRIVMLIDSTANAAASTTGKTTSVMSVESTADAEETLRLPATAIPILWANTMTGAAAQWTGLPFNSMVEVDGTLYGASADGIFALSDTADDNGTAIDSEVLWDLETFGSRQKKRLDSVYVAAATQGPFTVRVINEQGTFDYITRLPHSAKATNHRAKCGKGLESAYYRIGLLSSVRFGTDHLVAEYQDLQRKL